MADFDKDLRLPGGQLVQQAIYDQNGKLIEPWRAPFAIRKGTLIAADVQLHIYHFVEGSRPNHVRFSFHMCL